MKRINLIIILFCASLIAGSIARFADNQELTYVLVAPAVILSGWAFFGHFVTLDEDMFGGWSNPDDSAKIVTRSISELLVKLSLFILTMYVAMG